MSYGCHIPLLFCSSCSGFIVSIWFPQSQRVEATALCIPGSLSHEEWKRLRKLVYMPKCIHISLSASRAPHLPLPDLSLRSTLSHSFLKLIQTVRSIAITYFWSAHLSYITGTLLQPTGLPTHACNLLLYA